MGFGLNRKPALERRMLLLIHGREAAFFLALHGVTQG